MCSKMSSNFSSNSILISESFKNDSEFFRDVPDLLTPECLEQQVPHFYITLPALGPLWCSWCPPRRMCNQGGLRQKRGISFTLWKGWRCQHRRGHKNWQPMCCTDHVQITDHSWLRGNMGIDLVSKQTLHTHWRQQPSYIEDGLSWYHGVCWRCSKGKLHCRMFRQKQSHSSAVGTHIHVYRIRRHTSRA